MPIPFKISGMSKFFFTRSMSRQLKPGLVDAGVLIARAYTRAPALVALGDIAFAPAIAVSVDRKAKRVIAVVDRAADMVIDPIRIPADVELECFEAVARGFRCFLHAGMRARAENDPVATDEAAAKTLTLDHTAARARSVIMSLERGMSVGIGALGALFVLSDRMTVGALIAFNMLGLRLAQPLIQASGLMQEYQKAVLSLKLLAQLMQTKPEPASGQLAPAVRGHIEFEDVTFHYPASATPAVKDISFTVEPGQVIGIVGRSGSGKTTITRLLQGLYRPQTGLIKIDGQDLKELDLAHLRTQIGVVLQENFLFRGTVRDNITVTKPAASLDEVVRVAQVAGAHEFIQRLPHGYATMLEEGATNLSGGQRQRLAIARALIHAPPVLVFDEATSSLDPESEAIVQQHLAGIAHGRTIVIVTHRLSFVARADLIVVVDQGRIVQVGRHEALLRSCLPYNQLWAQQARVYQ